MTTKLIYSDLHNMLRDAFDELGTEATMLAIWGAVNDRLPGCDHVILRGDFLKVMRSLEAAIEEAQHVSE